MPVYCVNMVTSVYQDCLPYLIFYVIFVQKLQERTSLLMKSTTTEKTKKWSKVLIPEVISSEESENEKMIRYL